MKRQLLRTTPALAGVLLVSVALAACGTQGHAATAGHTGPAVGGDVLYVVDGGAAASQDGYASYASGQGIAAVSSASGGHAPLFSLPMGLTTPDHQRLYAATSAGGRTTITTYDTRA